MADFVEDEDHTDEAIAAINDGLPASLEEVHQQTVERIVAMMGQGRDAMGRPWAPLKPSTVAAKGHSTPLVDGGDLMSSIEEDSEVNTADNIAYFATTLPYGPAHEYGLPEKGIPPRPFLGPGLQYASTISDDVFEDKIGTRLDAVMF